MVRLVGDENCLGNSWTCTSTIHPLLIDHVVHKILSYAIHPAERSDLLAYRLVCRLWNEIASSIYRSIHHVEVGSYSTSVPKFRKLIKLRREHPRKSNNPWPCPFAKFRLCQEVFQPLYSGVLCDFFQTFQDNLEVLDIWLDLRSSCTDASFAMGKQKKSGFQGGFPNLKTLVYDDRRVILQESKESRGNLLSELTSLCPNLQHLSIRFQRQFRGSVERSSETLLYTIREVFQRKQIQKSLKNLKIDLHVNNDLLECLASTKLRLQSLEVALRGSTFSFLAFRKFLESQKYLQKLKLSYIERDSHCLISFPRMGALRELEIDGTDAFSKHSVAFGEFTYKENLPNLQSLRVNIWATSNLHWGQFFPRKPQIWHVSELKLPGELCDRNMMITTAWSFPKLRKLQISLYSGTLDTLEVVFENMRQLEELIVMKFPTLWDRSEKSIDHILTGISVHDCDVLMRDNVDLAKLTDSQIAKLKSKSGLSDLKNLKKFIMPDLQYQASYTDISGFLAFQKMPNLQFLNVGRSCLSTLCLMLLAQKFPEMEIQLKTPPAHLKDLDDDDEASFLELPGDTCIYL